MAWSDKPTEVQIGALTRDYEALIYDMLDDAKQSGARAKVIALEKIIEEDLVRKAIMLIPDRGEMTRAIASGNQHMNAAVANYLESFCAQHEVIIKFSR